MKLSLEWLLVSTFWLWSGKSGTSSLHFAQASYEIERPALKTGKCWYVGAELTLVATKVSLMLDNPFLVNSYCKSLCKLNHISVYFIQISTKSPAKSLFPSGKAIFFWSHPRCFGPLGKFQHNIKISIKTIISVFPDYLFLMTMIKLIQKFDGNFHLHFSQIIGKPNLFNSTFQQTFNCPKSTLKTLEKDVKYVQSRADVLIVSFEHVSQLFLEFLLLTLSNKICYS